MADMLPPRLMDELTHAHRRWVRDLEAILTPLDLTLDQWRALRWLQRCPGLTMGELVEQLQMPAPSATRLVDGLVDRALVFRRAPSADRRRAEMNVSAAGAELVRRAEPLAAGHERSVQDALTDVLDAVRETQQS